MVIFEGWCGFGRVGAGRGLYYSTEMTMKEYNIPKSVLIMQKVA